MSRKPYIFEKLEWLEIASREDWINDKTNPDDLAQYSELQRPYAQPEGEDTYQGYEWTWPDINFPDIPPIVTPDPGEPSPCTIDEDCVWAGIIGPDSMECDECFTWSQAHLYYGCDIAPWWAAFGTWTLDSADDECFLLFSGPVMATVCCSSVAATQTLTLSYQGPLNCYGSVEIIVECGECCAEFTLSGASTVAPGSTWTGTISPACPGASCTVISNSGCSLDCTVNEAGSQVTVDTDAGDCGGFTIIVTDETTGECTANSDSMFVKITGGVWTHDQSSSDLGLRGCDTGTCPGQGGNTAKYNDFCYSGAYKYGGWEVVGLACEGNWGYWCYGTGECSADGSQPPCMSKSDTCGDCIAWSWWRCVYECSC